MWVLLLQIHVVFGLLGEIVNMEDVTSKQTWGNGGIFCITIWKCWYIEPILLLCWTLNLKMKVWNHWYQPGPISAWSLVESPANLMQSTSADFGNKENNMPGSGGWSFYLQQEKKFFTIRPTNVDHFRVMFRSLLSSTYYTPVLRQPTMLIGHTSPRTTAPQVPPPNITFPEANYLSIPFLLRLYMNHLNLSLHPL